MSESSLPVVSCLMVMRGNTMEAAQSLWSFLHQSYPHRELIIVGASYVPVLRFCGDHAMVRVYKSHTRRMTDDQMLDYACEHATGSIATVWSEAHIAMPWRIEAAVNAMVTHGAPSYRETCTWSQADGLFIKSWVSRVEDWFMRMLDVRRIGYEDVSRSGSSSLVKFYEATGSVHQIDPSPMLSAIQRPIQRLANSYRSSSHAGILDPLDCRPWYKALVGQLHREKGTQATEIERGLRSCQIELS